MPDLTLYQILQVNTLAIGVDVILDQIHEIKNPQTSQLVRNRVSTNYKRLTLDVRPRYWII